MLGVMWGGGFLEGVVGLTSCPGAVRYGQRRDPWRSSSLMRAIRWREGVETRLQRGEEWRGRPGVDSKDRQLFQKSWL